MHGHDSRRDQIGVTGWQLHDRGTAGLILVGAVGQTLISFPDALKDFPQIAIDGGIRTAVNPVLWCGDGDSGFIPDQIPSFFKENQTKTDFQFCLEGIRDWVWSELHLFNFLGARRDHELACLGAIYAEMLLRPKMSKAVFYEDQGTAKVAVYPAGFHEISVDGLFSIMTFEKATVSISGECLYQAADIVIEPLSGHGVSNEGTGRVVIRSDKPVIIFMN